MKFHLQFFFYFVSTQLFKNNSKCYIYWISFKLYLNEIRKEKI